MTIDNSAGGENIDLTKTKTQTAEEAQGKDGDSQTHASEDEATGKSDEDTGADDADADGDDKGGDDKGGEDEDDSINPDTGKPFTAEEWRDKFRESSRGANGLLERTKVLETDLAKVKADGEAAIKAKEDEHNKVVADLRAIAEGKNPEGLSIADLNAKLKTTSDELVVIKENGQLDTFLAGTKVDGATNFKEALRALSRANPSTPLDKLWGDNLKAGAEAAAAAIAAKRKTTKEGASDSGRGSSSREHAKTGGVAGTGMSPEEFRKLPLAKRKDILQKAGM